MRMMFFACVCATPALIACGCGSGITPPSKLSTKVSSPRSTAEVTLTEGTVANLDTAVKEIEKEVILIEFWSLVTEPSPDLALANNSRGGDQQARGATLGKDKVAWYGMRKAQYLAQKYEGYFLRVIAVNVDGLGKKDEVLKYLKGHDARHVTNFILKDNPSHFAERYGFNGKVPHQIVFGRNGNKVWATGDPLSGTLDDLLFHELDK